MSNLKEKIKVMQAALDGKPIQLFFTDTMTWIDCDTPQWNWGGKEYRVKPPKPVDLFVVMAD